ncbi:MAG: hypothetical protein JSW61_02815 [Candidatus Thorarchaeota archaeon]|nr:MAG: hypothetical protein JSW61_02815 [Candidatus Thorarchaeota archaeon]
MKRRLIVAALIVPLLLSLMPYPACVEPDFIRFGFVAVDNGVWTEMNPADCPVARFDSPLVYDSESDRVIMYGGHQGRDIGMLNDTWAYDYETDTWTDMSPTIAPSARASYMMAYDSESDVVILFGGHIRIDETIGHVCHNDTWAYDYDSNTWTNMNPPLAPTARVYSAVAYDSESDRIIIFGGILEGTVLASDTWAYDYNTNTWEEMDPSTQPSTRFHMSVAYNSEADLIILFGGSRPSLQRDTWSYDYNADNWTRLSPDSRPVEQSGHMTYDPVTDQCIFFGGYFGSDETILSSATWAYDYSTNNWTVLETSVAPLNRARAPIVYDVDSERVIMFGGIGPEEDFALLYNDTWAFDVIEEVTTTTTTTPPDGGIDVTIVVLAVLVTVGVLAVLVVFVRRK